MKIKIYLMLLLFLISSNIFSQNKFDEFKNEYYIGEKECEIIEISRQKDAYIIYAKSNDYIYKIVSLVEENNQCNDNIKIGKKYKLFLYSYFNINDIFHQVKRVKISPGNIIEADDKNNLYYSTNLHGISYNEITNFEVIVSLPLQSYIVRNIYKVRKVYILRVENENTSAIFFSKDIPQKKTRKLRVGDSICIELHSYFKGQPYYLRYGYPSYCFDIETCIKIDLKTRNAYYSKSIDWKCN